MRGYAAIGLSEPKNPLNVGEVMRAAGCYGAALVAVSGTRYSKAKTDTQAAHRHIPLLKCDDIKAVIPHRASVVAVDIVDGASPLQEFQHPESAFYVFGPEDGTISDDILKIADHVVYVPTRQCMNLAATVNVVLYDRMSKANKHVALAL